MLCAINDEEDNVPSVRTSKKFRFFFFFCCLLESKMMRFFSSIEMKCEIICVVHGIFFEMTSNETYKLHTHARFGISAPLCGIGSICWHTLTQESIQIAVIFLFKVNTPMHILYCFVFAKVSVHTHTYILWGNDFACGAQSIKV